MMNPVRRQFVLATDALAPFLKAFAQPAMPRGRERQSHDALTDYGRQRRRARG